MKITAPILIACLLTSIYSNSQVMKITLLQLQKIGNNLLTEKQAVGLSIGVYAEGKTF